MIRALDRGKLLVVWISFHGCTQARSPTAWQTPQPGFSQPRGADCQRRQVKSTGIDSTRYRDRAFLASLRPGSFIRVWFANVLNSS